MHQKADMLKQREEYVKKSSTLQRELEILRKQYEEISKEGGRENNRIIKENQKLQVCIQLFNCKQVVIHNLSKIFKNEYHCFFTGRGSK